MQFDTIIERINKITSSSEYEGDFGDTLDDVKLILSEAEHLSCDIPEDYIEFIKRIGYGELDATFYIEDGPYLYEKTYGRKIEELNGMYIFATDQSEYVYAFNTNNNYTVEEIDSSGNISKHLGNFSSFIDKKLNEIIGYLKWREDNQ